MTIVPHSIFGLFWVNKYLEHMLRTQNVFSAESGMNLMSPVTRAQLPNSSHPPAHLSLFTSFLKWMLLSFQEQHLYFGRLINSNSNCFSGSLSCIFLVSLMRCHHTLVPVFVFFLSCAAQRIPSFCLPFFTTLNNLLKFLLTACSLTLGVLTLVSKAHSSTVDVKRGWYTCSVT